MSLQMKTAKSVTKTLDKMFESTAQHQRLRPLLEVLGALVMPGGADSPGFVTTPYGHIQGRNGETVYETHRDPEPSFITWKVRWYRDGETVWIIDIEN